MIVSPTQDEREIRDFLTRDALHSKFMEADLGYSYPGEKNPVIEIAYVADDYGITINHKIRSNCNRKKFEFRISDVCETNRRVFPGLMDVLLFRAKAVELPVTAEESLYRKTGYLELAFEIVAITKHLEMATGYMMYLDAEGSPINWGTNLEKMYSEFFASFPAHEDSDDLIAVMNAWGRNLREISYMETHMISTGFPKHVPLKENTHESASE